MHNERNSVYMLEHLCFYYIPPECQLDRKKLDALTCIFCVIKVVFLLYFYFKVKIYLLGV